MKKLLVVLLALTFVVIMATAAFAVTTSTFDGKVEWTYTSGDQFGGSDDGKLSFDLGKDFGEGYTAGLKIKIVPGDADEVVYDGNGWIQMVKDYGTFKFQTGGLGGNAANELGKGYDMNGNPGMQFTSTTLVDGLSLTVVLNDQYIDVVAPADKRNSSEDTNYLNYLLKAVYTTDVLTLGAGYQAHTQPVSVTDSAANDMYAVWAGYKLGESLNFGLEYAGRPNVNGVVGTETVEGATGIRVKADYTAGALTLNGKVQIQSGRFFNMDPDDIGTTSAFNFFQYGYDLAVGKNDDPKDGTGIAGTALKLDAKYQLTEALSVSLSVEDIMNGVVTADSIKADPNPAFNPLLPADPITNPEFLYTTVVAAGSDLVDDMAMSYKLAVTDVLNEKVTLDGWYAGYGPVSEIGVKATYTFVTNLVGSLEVKSVTAAEGADADNTYTATIKATL